MIGVSLLMELCGWLIKECRVLVYAVAATIAMSLEAPSLAVMPVRNSLLILSLFLLLLSTLQLKMELY